MLSPCKTPLPGTHYARVDVYGVLIFEPCERCGGTLGEPVRMALDRDQQARLTRCNTTPPLCQCEAVAEREAG